MKKLIVVRHGNYSLAPPPGLTKEGEQQMANCAKKLAPFVNGSSVLVLSSMAERALQSTGVLIREMGEFPIEQFEPLWSGSDSPAPLDYLKALNIIRHAERRADVVVVVTHLEYAEMLPRLFAKTEWGVQIPYQEIENGEMTVLDCAAQKATFVGQ